MKEPRAKAISSYDCTSQIGNGEDFRMFRHEHERIEPCPPIEQAIEWKIGGSRGVEKELTPNPPVIIVANPLENARSEQADGLRSGEPFCPCIESDCRIHSIG